MNDCNPSPTPIIEELSLEQTTPDFVPDLVDITV